MEITVENIEKALSQFYQDAASQREVHSWLTAVQGSPQAWTFCWKLLEKNRQPEVQFFGANCLHWKISRYWHEIPAEQIGPLRSQLFEHIASYALGPKMILTRLCVALSAFTLHSTPAVWPDAVQNIITTFQQSNLPHLECSQLCLVLLELLTVLPEEFSTCPLPQHQKGVVRAELERGVQYVLPLLDGLMTVENRSAIYEQALRCLSSWVQFGIPLTEVEALVPRLAQAVQNEALFDTAVDALVSVFSHHDNHRYPNCVQRLLPLVTHFEPMLQAASQEKDMEKVQGLVRFIVMATSNSSKVLVEMSAGTPELAQLSLTLVKMVMECTALPGQFPVDENCSDISFGFWYNLQDDILSGDNSKFQQLSQTFVPVYMSLIDVLLRKLQFPSDSEYESWNAEEKEQFRCYRQDISDTLMYSYNLLNTLVLNNLCRLLASILEKSAAEEVRWQEVEAVLFAVTSIAESVDIEEDTFLPSLFQMLSRVPCTSPKLVSQALYLIGSYAEWLSVHPEMLNNVLPLILQGLRNEELAQSATLSLKEVVRENQEHLMIYSQQILTAGKEALESNILKPRDSVRLMMCLGFVLSVLPVSEIMDYLNQVLGPHFEVMRQLANVQPTASNKAALVQRINMVSWLFSSLNIHWREESEKNIPQKVTTPPEPQPVLLILQQLMPVLGNLLQVWVVDVGVVDSICDMLKRGLRTLMDDFTPLAVSTSVLTVQMFNAAPQPPVLDLAKQLLTLFASDQVYHSTASVLFQGICTKCLAVYEAGIREHPDLASSFMAFLAQVAKKNSSLFSQENCNLTGLFQAAVISLSMPESPTVKSACQFLSELINCSPKSPAVHAVVAQNGHALLERLVRSIGGESPRNVLDPMADVFLALNKHHFDLISSLLKVMVTQEGFPSERAKPQDKELFRTRILRERVNKRRLKETITEFTLLWRGLLGTEYAAQTTT